MVSLKNNKESQARALVLFSGGLDSRLVVKMLQEQGIEVTALNFILPFGCGCCSDSGCNLNFCQTQKVKLIHIDCTTGKNFEEYMKLLENPKYGFGKGMNPCINCRIFMLERAKKLMKKLGADFIATGEVVGQRPMSQYRRALESIEKDTKLVGKILRPLSAKILSETQAEKQKLVNREKLLGLSGRTRQIQMELASKFKIKYPTPAGGCLLCDKNYCIKLKDLIEHKQSSKRLGTSQKNKARIIHLTPAEILSLNGFRHFRNNGKIILGRNQEQNNNLEEINKTLGYNLMLPEKVGPTALYENKKDKKLTKELIKAYSSKDLEDREKSRQFRLIKTDQ